MQYDQDALLELPATLFVQGGLVPCMGARMRSDELVSAYWRWSVMAPVSRFLSKPHLLAAMRDYGYVQRKVNGVRFWADVAPAPLRNLPRDG